MQANEAEIDLYLAFKNNTQDAYLLLDEKLFSHVIINIIENALKYTPRGGRVTISVNYISNEHKVQIDVRDTGVGITDVSAYFYQSIEYF